MHGVAAAPRNLVFGRDYKERGNRLLGSVACHAGILDTMRQWAQTRPMTPKGGANLYVSGVSYHPVGCEKPILENAGLYLAANELGLVYGRSGSGKTSLMQVIAGLSEATEGSIWISRENLTEGNHLTTNYFSGRYNLATPVNLPSLLEFFVSANRYEPALLKLS